MDNKDYENTVPAAIELELFQDPAEPEPEISSENEGTDEQSQMEVVAAAAEPEITSENEGIDEQSQMEVVAAAADPEPEPDNLLDDSGSGEQMEVVAAAAEPEPEPEQEPDNLLKHSGNGEQMVVAVANGYGDDSLVVKRKRGRPRKELGEIRPECRLAAEVNSGGPQKRGRGRPKGSGKWQTWGARASLGFSAAGEASASNLTPYVIDIQAGENIVERIWSFSQMTSDSICILSASGTVSSADFYLPASRGGALRYEGQFSIICLNGSHTYKEKSSAKTCLLSAQLSSPDGRFCGGAVANSLIASGPTQVIISTFKQNMRQQRSKARAASIAASKPNEMSGGSAAPVQEENGRAAAADDDEEEEGTMDEPNVANQSPDWRSLQPSNIYDV